MRNGEDEEATSPKAADVGGYKGMEKTMKEKKRKVPSDEHADSTQSMVDGCVVEGGMEGLSASMDGACVHAVVAFAGAVHAVAVVAGAVDPVGGDVVASAPSVAVSVDPKAVTRRSKANGKAVAESTSLSKPFEGMTDSSVVFKAGSSGGRAVTAAADSLVGKFKSRRKSKGRVGGEHATDGVSFGSFKGLEILCSRHLCGIQHTAAKCFGMPPIKTTSNGKLNLAGVFKENHVEG